MKIVQYILEKKGVKSFFADKEDFEYVANSFDISNDELISWVKNGEIWNWIEMPILKEDDWKVYVSIFEDGKEIARSPEKLAKCEKIIDDWLGIFSV